MAIKPQVVETNTDLLTANLFTFEFIGYYLKSPNFSRYDGMARNVEQVEQPDGGSGLVRKFHGGVVRYEDVSITRVRDGSINDRAMSDFVTNYFTSGRKYSGAMIKRHGGRIVIRTEFTGMSAMGEQWPSFDNAAPAGFEMTYPMACDYYEEVFF
jgi:hypothetical protein